MSRDISMTVQLILHSHFLTQFPSNTFAVQLYNVIITIINGLYMYLYILIYHYMDCGVLLGEDLDNPVQNLSVTILTNTS